MIPQKYKLSLRKIKDFFSITKRYYSHYFVFFVRKNTAYSAQTSSIQPVQIAVVIPKKNVKLRVDRSLIKRRVYAALLPFLKTNQIFGSDPGLCLEIVIVGNKKIMTASWSDIKNDLEKSWQKIISTS